MADHISKAEAAAMLKNTISPVQTRIKIVNASIDAKIQTGIQGLDCYVCKTENGIITVGSSKVDAKTVKDKDVWGRALYRILMYFVDNGSSEKNKGSKDRYIFINIDKGKKDEYGAFMSNEVIAVIKLHTENPRRWTRRYADHMFDYIGMHDINPGLAVKWGVPPQFKQIAFDFVDALDIKKITDMKMLVCLNTTVAANLARVQSEEASAVVNASYLYHAGQINGPPRMSRLLK